MSLLWVDPLRLILDAGLAGRDSSLIVVRQNFGSEMHFRFMKEYLTGRNNFGPRIIDLTPFQRLGNQSAFRNLLVSSGILDRSFLLVASRTLYEDLEIALPEIGQEGKPSIVPFELRGDQLVADQSVALRRLIDCLEPDDSGLPASEYSYGRLRMGVMESELLDWISGVTLKPPDLRWKGEVETLEGKEFLRMPNGMLVTHFVLMKALLHEVGSIDRLAYEVAAHSCHGFCPNSDSLWPDMLVASSDHSYLVGAAVQRLTGIKCAVIDRIGLLPGRRLTRDTISLDVTGKRTSLIVDVSATASEMERAASLLIHRGAQLQMIICSVWLECALPKFVDWFRFVPLCKPKKKLRYVYRSAP